VNLDVFRLNIGLGATAFSFCNAPEMTGWTCVPSVAGIVTIGFVGPNGLFFISIAYNENLLTAASWIFESFLFKSICASLDAG
jgi:hypothetical protein